MLNRREFLYNGSLASLALSYNCKIFALEQHSAEPHFFMHYSMTGGLDKTYTFDSRPLDMMAKKMQQNFLDKEPKLVKNHTGGVAYFSDIVDPLLKYRDHFSVLNGVMMSPSFDGHIENSNEILSGQALGGGFYLPEFNLGSRATPIDYIQMGQGLMVANVSNTGGGVNLSLAAAQNLKEKLAYARDLSSSPKLQNYLQRSFRPGPDAKGGFEKTRLLMGLADEKGRSLQLLLNNIKLPEVDPNNSAQQDENTLPKDLDLMIALFKSGTSRSALYLPGGGQNRNLDAHDLESAKNSPTIIGGYIEDMTYIFKTLKETPYDDKRSMLDVTTILITSEISRTMRTQSNKPEHFETMGTDHNQLSNTVLIGGKGIKSNLIIGSSDLQSVEEFEKGPSKAHLSIDENKVKTMGRPFDCKTFRERKDLPETFKAEDYLSINSVMNTVYSLFNLPKEHWRQAGQSSKYYPILSNLI